MTREEFEDLVARWHTKGLDMMRGKSDDYAREGDVLQDFHNVHLLCQILNIDPAQRPEDTARFMMVAKLDRDANLIGREAQNESRADTLLDLQNYLYLYRAMLEAKEVEECMWPGRLETDEHGVSTYSWPDWWPESPNTDSASQLEPVRGPYVWPRSHRVAPVTPKTEEAKE